MDEAATAAEQRASPLLGLGPATAAVAAISTLGVLLTGLCLVMADRLARSTPAQVLAVLAVVAALTGVMVAVAGNLWATLPSRRPDGAGSQRTRRGLRVVLIAGVLSMVAVVLVAAATLLGMLHPERKTMAGPAVTLQLSGAPGARALAVQFSVPGLPAGSVVDARLIGESQEDAEDDGQLQTIRSLLARSVVPAGGDGLAVAQLAAPIENYRNVVIDATMPDRSCKQILPLDDIDAAVPALTCTPN